MLLFRIPLTPTLYRCRGGGSRRTSAHGLLSLALLLVSGCLPGDTRPPPAKVYSTVEPAASLTEGFDTSDGWRIKYDRALMGLGRVDPDGVECPVYGSAWYSRLFELTLPGKQKVSEVYALGPCDMGFRISRIDDDDVLGAGVTEADRAFMREPGTDFFVTDTGASVYLLGTATKAGETKRFEWTFRVTWELTRCLLSPDSDAGLATSLDLRGEQTVEFPLEVRGEEPFRERADDAAPISFERLAKADADADGTITLEELAALPAPIELDAGMQDAGGLLNDASAGIPDAGVDPMDTFAGYLYMFLAPRMVRVKGGGACQVELRPSGGRPHGPPI